jgi:isopenicillin-N epimerase
MPETGTSRTSPSRGSCAAPDAAPPSRPPSPQEVRGQWTLAPGVAHLNHGSFGAVPRKVRLAQELLRREVDENPMRFFRRELPGRLERARLACAGFVGAEPDSLVFMASVMAGVSTVLASITLRPGDDVVVTEHVYGAARIAVDAACRRSGATVRVAHFGLEDQDADRADAVVAAVTQRTRLVVLEQVTSSTALVLPVQDIVRRLRPRGVQILLDGAHAVAATALSVSGLEVDYWVGSLHKWLCAPPGGALLAVAKRHRDRVVPLVATWNANDLFPGSFGSMGTVDPTSFLAAPEAIDLFTGWGWEWTREHNRRLITSGADAVAEAFGTASRRPIRPFDCMRLVALPGRPRMDLRSGKLLQDRIAEQLGIELSVVSWRGHGWVRLSAQIYNTSADFARLADSADQIAGWVRRTGG